MATVPNFNLNVTDLAEAIVRAIKQLGAGPSLGFNPASAATDTIDKLKKSVIPTAASFDSLKTQITNSLDVWRNLSKVGANFNNDLTALTISATEARLELHEFADVVGQNATQLAGLGGSVSRGVEAFAKLSKEFNDSKLNIELRELGYTSKEVSEVLALNLSFQKSSMKMDETGKTRSLSAAFGLAQEMDSLAKMTGKSREEQAKQLREAQRDAAVESKFRLIGIKQGANAEKEARAGFAKEYAKAEAMGSGQLFKDMFTKGVPASEEAATQLALTGKAGKETAEAARLLGKGLTAEAEAASNRAAAANLQNQNNPALLAIGTLGELGGTASKVIQQNITANDTLYHSTKQIAEANGMLLKSQEDYALVLQKLRDDIKESQKGIDKGVTVGGTTAGLVAAEKAVQDARAGIASSMKVVDDGGKSIATTLNNVGRELAVTAASLSTYNKNIRQRIEEEAKKGISASYAKTAGEPNLVGKVAGEAHRAATGPLENIASDFIEEAGKLLQPEVKKRNTGTIGATGNLFENFGSRELVELHGVEAVMKPDQLQDIVEKTANTALKAGVNSAPAAKLDMASISSTIKTVFSSVQAPTRTPPPLIAANTASLTPNTAHDILDKITEFVGQTEKATSQLLSTTDQKIEQVKADVKATEQLSSATNQQLEQVKADVKNSSQLSSATDQKIEQVKADVKATEQLSSATNQQLEQVKADVKNSSQLSSATDQKIEQVKADVKATEQLSSATNQQLEQVKADVKTPSQLSSATDQKIEQVKADVKATEQLSSATTAVATAPAPETTGKINLNAVNLPGMKGFGYELKAAPKTPESTGAAASSAQLAADSEAKKKEEAKKEEAKKKEEAAASSKLGSTTTASTANGLLPSGKASLDDILGSLNRLNTQISQLITQQSDLLNRQIKTTRSSGSANVYDRVTP